MEDAVNVDEVLKEAAGLVPALPGADQVESGQKGEEARVADFELAERHRAGLGGLWWRGERERLWWCCGGHSREEMEFKIGLCKQFVNNKRNIFYFFAEIREDERR